MEPEKKSDTHVSTPNHADTTIHNNTLMGVLSYLGPLVFVSYALSKNDPFVKFHIKQGMVLFVIEVALWILGMSMYSLYMIIPIINLAILVLSIIGIINVVNKKETPLPVVGSFSKYFTF